MTLTLEELLNKIRAAQAVMSRTNAHRVLFGECEAVLLAFVAELEQTQKRLDGHKEAMTTEEAGRLFYLAQRRGGALAHDIFATSPVRGADRAENG